MNRDKGLHLGVNSNVYVQRNTETAIIAAAATPR